MDKLFSKIKIIILLAACMIAITSCKSSTNASDKSNNEPKDRSTVLTSDSSDKLEEKVNTEKKKSTEGTVQSTLEQEYNKAYGAFFDGNYKEAIKISDEIIKKDINFYKAYNIKGIALCFSHDFDGGMKNIDKALSINPDFGYGRFNKALAYELYGHYQESLEWYDKALEVENYIWSYYGKASIYGRRGDAENTVKYLKIAIDMDSNIKEEAKKEKDFDKVRNSEEFIKLVE